MKKFFSTLGVISVVLGYVNGLTPMASPAPSAALPALAADRAAEEIRPIRSGSEKIEVAEATVISCEGSAVELSTTSEAVVISATSTETVEIAESTVIYAEPQTVETPQYLQAADMTKAEVAYPITADERYWLERLVEAEAGNQSIDGRKAVAEVVLNRVADENNFMDDIMNVIFEKDDWGNCQFSPVSNGYIYEVVPSAETIAAVDEVLAGNRFLPEGVLFFVRTDCISDWFWTRTFWGYEGSHAFFY